MTTRSAKTQRQHRITQLLESRMVNSQAQLVSLLAEEGIEATQTTVSRDLEELGRPQGAGARRRDRVRLARAARAPGRPRGPPAPGARGVGRRHGALGQPGRAAHPAGLGARRRLGARPQRLGRGDRHRRRRRHGARGGGRRSWAERPWPAGLRPGWPGTGAATEEIARDREGVERWRSGWCWPTAAVSTRRWPCVGCRRSSGSRSSRWRSTWAGGWTSRPSGVARSAAGAVEAAVVDARREMAEEFCVPALAANARYEGKYPLVSALSRPVIVRHLVAEARRHGADGGGPRLHGQGQRPGPLRGGDPRARPRPRDPGAGAGLGDDPRGAASTTRRSTASPSTATKEKLYSIDENLWGTGHRVRGDRGPVGRASRGRLHPDPADGERRAPSGRRLRAGVPVSLDGRRLPVVELIAELGRIGRVPPASAASTWWRTAGSGSRAARSTSAPAALALIVAHADLEDLTLERDVAHEKARLEPRWAELVYDGMWFSPLKRGARRLLRRDPAPRHRRGAARASRRGPAPSSGRRSPVALYDHGLATYDAARHLPPPDAEGSCACGGSAWPPGRRARGRDRPASRRLDDGERAVG